MGKLYGLLAKEIVPKPVENAIGGRRWKVKSEE